MDGKPSVPAVTPSSGGIITLEALQAAAKGLQSQTLVGRSKVRICSCNSQYAPCEASEHEESRVEDLAHA
jgi:hypothetical protein